MRKKFEDCILNDPAALGRIRAVSREVESGEIVDDFSVAVVDDVVAVCGLVGEEIS